MKGVINGEKVERRCEVCRENEQCNFCRWVPLDMSKHKHVFKGEYQEEQHISWIGRLLGKKSIKVTKLCYCGEKGRTYERDGLLEIKI